MPIKKYHPKTPRHNTYKEIEYKNALHNALSYTTWGLVWDSNKEERERTRKLNLKTKILR